MSMETPKTSAITALIMDRKTLLAHRVLTLFLLVWALFNMIANWPAAISVAIAAIAIVNFSLAVIVSILLRRKSQALSKK
ncbi:hypothetical protein NIZ92_06510 [Alcaligenes sp. 1735tsa3]|uniref:hypothetical protein n=1 Tax=Alcaligenes sp. 1735tsa3 TaxID=2953809 RepID=UPI0020A8065D|nr:hypothetical protein [Alcaligenes sp. 1735tsa3]USY26683.1 hypothetical protein NIZ92_06510 [Alcaligenes sp. 1735tsa3]